MKTDIETLRHADWDRVERETVERIRALRALAETLRPGPVNDKIAQDLILPAVALLGKFAARVKIEGGNPMNQKTDDPSCFVDALVRRGSSPRDYATGNYVGKCCDCGKFFWGMRHAILCRSCSEENDAWWDSLTKERQLEILRAISEGIRRVKKR